MKPPVASESNEGRTGKDGIIFFYHPNPTTRLIELFPKDFHIQIKSLGSSVFSCTPRFSKSSFEAECSSSIPYQARLYEIRYFDIIRLQTSGRLPFICLLKFKRRDFQLLNCEVDSRKPASEKIGEVGLERNWEAFNCFILFISSILPPSLTI